MNLRILTDEEHARLLADNPGTNFNVEKWCPTCKKKKKDNSGEYTYRWEGKVHPCDCEEQMMLFKHYLVSGIGKGYHRIGWRDYTRSDEIKAQLNKYVDNHESYVDEGMGLVFTGDIGTGKTMLANLVLKDLIKAGYVCHATAAADASTNLTAGWRDKKERRRYEELYEHSQILLIDDVGRDLVDDRTGEVGEAHKFKESVLDTILRKRVQYARPTFITTNLSVDGIREAYGAAVHSLFNENTIYVPMHGEDFRIDMVRRKLDMIDAREKAPIV